MKPFVILFISLLVVKQSVMAQIDASNVLKLTLEDVQKLTLDFNVTAKNSRLNTEIAKKRSLEILTTGLPQISGGINYQHNYKQQKSIIPAGAFSPDELEVTFVNPFQGIASLELQQLLVDGRYFLGLKANKAIMAVAEQQGQLTEINLKSTVAVHYINALVAREANNILKESYNIIAKSLSDLEAIYEQGLVEDIEVDRVRLRKYTLESQINTTAVNAGLLESVIKYNAGIPESQPIELITKVEDLLLVNEEEIENDVRSFSSKNRIEHKLLLTQHELRGYDKKQFALGYAPGLYGSVSYGANAFGQEANLLQKKWFGFGSVGVSLQIPIFDSYKKGAQYQQKKLEQEQAYNSLKDFEGAAAIDVKNNYSVYVTSLANYKTRKQNFELAQKIYEKTDIKYKSGVGSSVELAQADGGLAEERGQYISAIGNLLISKINLDKALGKIK